MFVCACQLGTEGWSKQSAEAHSTHMSAIMTLISTNGQTGNIRDSQLKDGDYYALYIT